MNERIRIDLIVEGISQGEEWRCGLEFDYSNPEAFFAVLYELVQKITLPVWKSHQRQ